MRFLRLIPILLSISAADTLLVARPGATGPYGYAHAHPVTVDSSTGIAVIPGPVVSANAPWNLSLAGWAWLGDSQMETFGGWTSTAPGSEHNGGRYTAGYGCASMAALSSMAGIRFRRNYGIGGATTQQILVYVDTLIAAKIKAVALMAGTNDYLTGTAATTYYRQILQKLRANGIFVFSVNIPGKMNTGTGTVQAWNAATDSICDSIGVPHGNPWAGIENVRTGLQVDPYTYDGTHTRPWAVMSIVGPQLARLLTPWSGNLPWIPSSILDAGVVPNALMVDTNSDGIADNWTAVSIGSGIVGVKSIVAPTNPIVVGNLQRFQSADISLNANGVQLWQDFSGGTAGTLVVGKTYEMSFYCDVTRDATIRDKFTIHDQAGTPITFGGGWDTNTDGSPNSFNGYTPVVGTSINYKGIYRTRFVVPSGLTGAPRIHWQWVAGVAGGPVALDAKIGEVLIRPVKDSLP